MYTNWHIDSPSLAGEHINIKELGIIAHALQNWAPLHKGAHIFIGTDNIFSMTAVNKGSIRNTKARKIVGKIAEIAMFYDIMITAYHIPGNLNCVSDSISRFHSKGQIDRFQAYLASSGYPITPFSFWFPCHMSELCAIFVLSQAH